MSPGDLPNRRGAGLGGVVHTYRGYDPVRFPPPTAPSEGDGLAALGDRMMAGGARRFTREEIEAAIRLPPEAIAGLGPSLEALLAMLRERREKILSTWNPTPLVVRLEEDLHSVAKSFLEDDELPKPLARRFAREWAGRQIEGLERLWYMLDQDEERESRLKRRLPGLIESMIGFDRIEGLRDGWPFHGTRVPNVEEATEVREELERIDELIKQLEDAKENGQLAIVDLEELRSFVEDEDLLGDFDEARERARKMLEEMASRQGMVEDGEGGWKMGPRAMRAYQSTLLSSVFAAMTSSRRGRHDVAENADGAVELPSTRPWEFGDPVSNLDLPASILNAVSREAADPDGRPANPRFRSEDLCVHRSTSTTKCATVVILDMSGSMRWGGQYLAAKKMAMALEGLVRREYPGDRLHIIEMYSVARVVPRGGLVDLFPKPVTIHDPVVRLRADMSDPEITESDLPPHFTNIQHALRLARRLLAGADTPNRQVVLMTDGLPTAHFEDEQLYLLYPPDPRTEEATMREAAGLAKDGGVLNCFLVPSWSQSEEDLRFGRRLAESTGGRVVFTSGDDLDRFVIWDYLERRRRIVG